MRNKNVIIVLTALISALCLFFLSFTWVKTSIMDDAVSYATRNGKYDPKLKQRYVDSLWQQPVYLGTWTLKEVTEKALNLGLDLQGGMHVVLEVSPVEILSSLAGKTTDPQFREALRQAQQAQANSQANFVDLFYQTFQKVAPGRKLASVFSNSTNRGKINAQSSDAEVLKVIKTEVEGAIDRAFQIITTRVDKFGVANPTIQRIPGTGRIQVELPGIDNPERARKLLSAAAKLEFLEVAELQEYSASMMQVGEYLLAQEKAAKGGATVKNDTTAKSDTSKSGLAAQLAGTAAKKDTTKKDTTVATTAGAALGKLFIQLPGTNTLGAVVKDTARINTLLSRPEIRTLFPGNYHFVWSVKGVNKTTNTNEDILELTAVKKNNGQAPLEGDVITDAAQDYDQSGRVEVTMAMNPEGARKWRNLTAANVGKRVAIVLDDYVYSAPNVINEIPNGRSSISGSFTLEEGKDLANVLKAGKLPAPTRIVEEAFVGPSLGQEAISQGYWSMGGGLALVVLFMILYYGAPGNVANVALIFNVFFIVGILAQFGAALTLPGIAGMVLTMGMAVDANVLINERIKEELHAGKGLLEALKIGHDKALSAIIDGNVTTFLIGAILYIFGQGGVKGFATTLMIGIGTTIFTAVYIAYLIMWWWAERKVAKGETMTFETGISRGLFKGMNFDFIEKRKYSYWFSWGLIALGVVCYFINGGFNLGVDFKGGRTYVVQFDHAIPASDVKEALKASFKGGSPEVKTYETNDKLKITTSYLVDDESEAANKIVETALNTGLQKYANEHPKVLSSSKVGATIADDIMQTSFVSIVYSLIAIFIYILIRFRKWQYSLGGVVAMAHDALVVIGMMCVTYLLGWKLEVDGVFIAAVLTVIGYSINDTVVVFDRIREYLGPNPDLTQKDQVIKTINASINQTMSRTVMTAATVFIVVTILLIFGGDVLRNFSFAMFIGVVFGAYSSIFVAAPIVVDFGTGKKKAVAEPVAATTPTPAKGKGSKKA
ncbi:MAG: protein translocase subunit SecDF [Spirosomataceae bacterium]